eukprot:2816-Pyramimonas_sp.AAC.1
MGMTRSNSSTRACAIPVSQTPPLLSPTRGTPSLLLIYDMHSLPLQPGRPPPNARARRPTAPPCA